MEAKIDAAIQDLDAFGRGGPTIEAPTATADRMHALLVMRTDALEGCTEGSPEEAELAALVDVIEAYQAVRWPLGRTQMARPFGNAKANFRPPQTFQLPDGTENFDGAVSPFLGSSHCRSPSSARYRMFRPSAGMARHTRMGGP